MGNQSNRDNAKAPGLVCQDLGVWRNGVCVIENLSFSVDCGATLMIAGPNGSGKTSILRAVAGFLDCDGDLSFRAGPLEAAQMHYVGHQSGLKQRLSVAENLRFMASILGAGQIATEAVTQGLALWGVDRLAPCAIEALSAGQLRRTAMARLSIIPRPVWLLDEPFTALDTAGREILTAQVEAHCAAGGLVVASSHEPLPFARHHLNLGGL